MVLSGSSLGTMAGLATTGQAVTAIPSDSNLSVVSTSPANSAVVTASPSELVVRFDRPINSVFVANNDFELLHLASDGSTSPMLHGEALLEESLDPDGQDIDLTLSKPLDPGSYQLALNPGSELQGVDGAMLANAGSALVLSDFTFSPNQGGLDSAVDLQVLGPQVTAVTGHLDLTTDPNAVQYYKFELAPGHHWLVGLEVPGLAASLSLFDSQGRLIESANEGLAGDPNDPYLFEGLDPGTYYVGIAAAKNLPDASGQYDPSAAVLDGSDSGGPFQLDVVADPADQPTQLLGIRVDLADPLSTAPTGLTLQFSGGLAVTSLENPSQSPLVLVDSSGNNWSLTPIHYDPTNGQLSLAFDQSLPPGTYTLELSRPDSLVDLAGREPITQGLPEGTLASFTVGTSTSAPGDIGPFLPGFATSGLASTVVIAPGRTVTESFDIIEPGVYGFEGIQPGGRIGFQIEDGSGHVLTAGPGDSSTGELDSYLPAGTYRVVLSNDGTHPLSASFVIIQKANQFSSLLESGVGQGPALNLRLVTPQADFGQSPVGSTIVSASVAQQVVNDSPSPSVGSTAVVADRSTATADGRSDQEVATVAIGLAIPSGPSVAGSFYGGGPAGRPSSQSSQIASVGPSGPSGLAAIASNSDDLPPGLFSLAAPIVEVAPIGPELAHVGGGDPEALETHRLAATLDSGILASSPGSRREDSRALAGADWIGQLVDNALDWVEGTPLEVETRGVEDPSVLAGQSPAPSSAPIEGSRLESASMASPIGLGLMLGLIAYESRRRLLRRKGSAATPGVPSILVGTHRRVRARVH